jgi:hypothetical protein
MKTLRKAFAVAFLGLLVSASVLAASVVRGPYLQIQTENGITIHWRTDVATDSVVRFGTTAGNLDSSELVAGLTTEHIVALTGLNPAQQYYYSVGDSTVTLAGDSTYHFRTAPNPGVAADTRIWVIGDSGTANANARAVRDAYKSWTASDPADFWLMLGDNAYNDGTDGEYQAAVFNTYPEILRQLPLWATLGNHDGHSADSGTQSGPYYSIFNLPKNGEAGGLSSFTEAYYSFDYANIHFVCLDSYDSDRASNGTMMTWLEADLAINTQPWVIAFWHHPPYTKGSHNSDTESQLIDMRQNALPILEAWGVDLVMSGHSHTYERSYLLDGHYGTSATLDPDGHVLNPGDGSETRDGVYEKPDILAAEHAGAVYAVAGSSGKVSAGYPLNHPAMFVSLESLGSMLIDVSGNRMDAIFLNQAGTVRDEFSIVKTPDFESPLISAAAAEDATHVFIDFNESLNSTEAIDPGNYTISGLTISQAELLTGDRRVRLTTSTMTDGASYTLAVSNVRDLAGNIILPGSTVDFQFFQLMTVSFQDGISPDPGYSGTRDAYIRQASADTAHGLETTLQVDGDEPSGSGTDMNMLLSWDISDIPADSIVEAASIHFEVTNPSSGAYTCYGLLRTWEEAQVSWNQALSGQAWGAAGATSAADRGSQPLCTVVAGSAGPLTVEFNADGLALLQSWIGNSTNNHGLVISDPATSDGADFHSRESATAMARPALEITYRVPVTPPPPSSVDQFALADLPAAGTLNGTYTRTFADDSNIQSITERDSGGKKNRRYSYLSHTWRFQVAAGSMITVQANAWSGGSSDGDNFVFAWSTDNTSFTDLFTVSSTSDSNVQSGNISTGGTIYIRVMDSNRQAGHRTLDTVFVNQLLIRSDNATPAEPPMAPSNLRLDSATSSSLTLAWQHPENDETGFDLERALTGSGNWSLIATPGAGSNGYTDSGLNADTGFDYRVRARNSAGVSTWTSIINVRTTTVASITLSLNGYKQRGVHVIDLSWHGAGGGNVDIVRDGSVITTTTNDGAYKDNTGNKGGRTYIYAVCESGTSSCSDDTSVVF